MPKEKKPKAGKVILAAALIAVLGVGAFAVTRGVTS